MLYLHTNALILIFPAFIFLSIAIYVSIHKKTRSSFFLLGVVLAFALYTIANMFELMSNELDLILLWNKIKYTGICIFSVLWLFLFLNRKMHFLLTGAILLVPAGVLLLVWTSHLHSYFFQAPEMMLSEGYYIFLFKQGIGYWIYGMFILTIFSVSALLTFLERAQQHSSKDFGYTILHFATLLPIIPLVLWLFNFPGLRHFNFMPFVFCVSSLLIVIVRYRFELFQTFPYARMHIIEVLKDPFLIVDIHQYVIDANPGFEELYKKTNPDKPLIGSNVSELYKDLGLSDDLRRQSFDRAVDWHFMGKHYEFESIMVKKGRQIKGIIHYFHDYTNRRNYEQQLRLSLLRLEKLNDLSRVLSMWMGKGDMTEITIKTATELLNSAFGALFFLESSGLKQRAHSGLEDILSADSPITTLLEEAAFEAITTAGTVDYKREPYNLLSVPLNAEILHGQPGAIVFIKSDEVEFSNFDKSIAESVARQLAVTVENARLYREVERRSQFDGLTGMYTRRHFESLAKQQFSFSLRHKRPFCIIMSDIDHFKNVNDSYGHPAGDAVLRQVAERLRVNIRSADILGRYGGEEFIILLPATEAKVAMKIAERIHKAIIKKTMSIGTGELEITASFGMSQYNPSKDKGLDQIIKRADSALYEAKETGRNRICFKKA